MLQQRFACAVCGTRNAGKLAAAYWAWFRADGVRSAWKQRLCVACAAKELSQLLASSQNSSSDMTMCPSCGADSSDDLDPVFLTLYVPGQERSDLSLMTCAACAVHVRSTALVGAEKLEDRSDGSSKPSAIDAWATFAARELPAT